jgi:hypothetical protein
MSSSTIDVIDKMRELKSLQKKELELLAALTAINESFAEQSIPVSTNDPKSGYSHPTPLPVWAFSKGMSSSDDNIRKNPDVVASTPSTFDCNKYRNYGIRMGNQLSFRGEDKAREYFDLIDIDHDGFVDYDTCKGENTLTVLLEMFDF